LMWQDVCTLNAQLFFTVLTTDSQATVMYGVHSKPLYHVNMLLPIFWKLSHNWHYANIK
jgi:hypothetical protein